MVTEAEAAYYAGNYDLAVSLAAEHLSKNPDDIDALFLLISALDARSDCFDVFRNGLALRNYQLFKLQKLPGIFPGSISPEMGQLLHALVRVLRPSIMVEVGTLFGYSTLCIAQALKDNCMGSLHSFDLFLRENYNNVTNNSADDAGLVFVQNQLKLANLDNIVTLHRGDSEKNLLKAFEGTEHKIDVAFIDGCHFIRGVLRDFSAVDRFLVDGGIIILHDTEPDTSGWMGPRFLAEKLSELSGYSTLICGTADILGIAIVQKRASAAENKHWHPSIKELLVEQLLFNKHFRFKLFEK